MKSGQHLFAEKAPSASWPDSLRSGEAPEKHCEKKNGIGMPEQTLVATRLASFQKSEL
jgi:hypothetical protein